MYFFVVFFFKQKTAYEMRISDWSSDVCSSDLFEIAALSEEKDQLAQALESLAGVIEAAPMPMWHRNPDLRLSLVNSAYVHSVDAKDAAERSEEHTSELQSLMRISYAVSCLKKKKTSTHVTPSARISNKNTTTHIDLI